MKQSKCDSTFSWNICFDLWPCLKKYDYCRQRRQRYFDEACSHISNIAMCFSVKAHPSNSLIGHPYLYTMSTKANVNHQSVYKSDSLNMLNLLLINTYVNITPLFWSGDYLQRKFFFWIQGNELFCVFVSFFQK